jgi:hypothetical protein
LKQKHQELESCKAKAEAESNVYKDKVLPIKEEIARGLVESVDVLNRVGINFKLCPYCSNTTL